MRSQRRAQAKMVARTLLSVWRRSEGSGNVYLRPTIRWRDWTTIEVATHGNVRRRPMERVTSSTSRSAMPHLLQHPVKRVQMSQVMMMVKNSWMNGTNGPNMKLEMDQKLTGKMFTMTSTLGKSQHLLKLHHRLLPQKTPTASPRSTTSWVQFLVCLVFIKTLNIVRSSVKLVWGLGSCSMRWSHVLLVVKRWWRIRTPRLLWGMSGWDSISRVCMTSPLFVNTMMLWQKQKEKEKKSTWHEFTAYVSKRTISYQRGALEESSKEEAFCLVIKLRTSTGKPRSFKTSAIPQRHLKPPDGQISMVVSPVTMWSWQMLSKHISKRGLQDLLVGSNSLKMHGRTTLTSGSSEDR